VPMDCDSMWTFARGCFLLSRRCAAAGLKIEAKALLELAVRASAPARGSRLDYRLFRAAALVLGWRAAGALASQIDRLRLTTRGSRGRAGIGETLE
jgi:hypothetical protein